MSRNASNLFFLPQDHNADISLVEIIMSRLGGFIFKVEEYYGTLYRVHDWVYVLSESREEDRRKPWHELKKMLLHNHLVREQDFKVITHKDPHGNIEQSDFSDEEMLYFIIQYMTFNDSVTAVRNYLAKAGVFLDTLRRSPEVGYDAMREAYRMKGKDEAWIDTRIEGIINRKRFTQALKSAVRGTIEQRDYGTATNDLYIGLWRRTRAILLEQMGLPENANLRDNQSRLALLFEGIAEEVCSARLGDKEQLGWHMARGVIQETAAKIGKYADAIGQDIGKDIPTDIHLQPGYEMPKLDGSGTRIQDWKTPRKIRSEND
jgi:hypothetical protein